MSYYNEDVHGDSCNYQNIGEFINRISTYNEYQRIMKLERNNFYFC